MQWQDCVGSHDDQGACYGGSSVVWLVFGDWWVEGVAHCSCGAFNRTNVRESGENALGWYRVVHVGNEGG